MSFERYPKDLIITKEDFINCGWKDILAETERKDYLSMWQAFSDAARKFMAEGQNSRSKIFWLLADACSMRLNPKSSNKPFKPNFVMEGKRGAIPEDFSDKDIEFFSQILDEIDDFRLKARIADILWLRITPRNPQYAVIAIDNYCSFPLANEIWNSDGHKCWERAIFLAYMLRKGHETLLDDIETALIDAFELSTSQDGYFSFKLAKTLLDNKFGQDDKTKIAEKIESIANEFNKEGKYRQAHDYFKLAAKLFKRNENESKSIEMIIGAAESLVNQAKARINSDTPSHMAAASFYDDAIQEYRTIPRSKRSEYNIDERISELRSCLNESGEKGMGELHTISSPPIDLSSSIAKARNYVHGKEVIDALISFVNSRSGIQYNELRDSTIKKMQDFPLQAMLSSTILSRDGRVIKKRPGLIGSEPFSPEDEIAIQAEMIHDSRMWYGLCVMGHILPALEVLVLEHRLCEVDFISIANRSPIVPKGREGLFGKALFAGYDYDFVTAIHLLVPQIENMVRFHLKSAGIKTTTLNGADIETENGLSTLIEIPECKKIFGEDITFEIKALFCDASGPNLRNELAHGLLSYDECQSAESIYAWWFALKLVLNTFWNSLQGTVEKKEAENYETQGEEFEDHNS